MKIDARSAERFCAAPPADCRAVLIYGPDAGLVRERRGTLTASVIPAPADPFRLAELTAASVLSDPARLGDEAAALSLTGGRRVVQLTEADDKIAELLRRFLDDPPGDALLLVESGDLPARSKLRALFDRAKNAASLACYRDEGEAVAALARKVFGEAGLTVSRQALDYLAQQLGGDRMVTRRELEKLALYKGAGEVTLEDAAALVGDSSDLTLEEIALAVAEGDIAGLEARLPRAFREGAQGVRVLRTTAQHLQRLHLAAGHLATGLAVKDAMGKLKPPVFWKHAPRVRRQLAAWSAPAVARALDRLLAAEIACKQTGAQQETLAARALLEIAAKAPRR